LEGERRILVEKPLRKSRRSWADNIKMDLLANRL
jgi:hypothetical protein